MGCDIHGSLEQKVKGKWVHYTRLTQCPVMDRNYARFAALAGVRGDGGTPLGFPADATAATKLHRERMGTDGHSDSCLSVSEVCNRLSVVDKPEPDSFEQKYPCYHYFHLDLDEKDADDFRIIFWFDS